MATDLCSKQMRDTRSGRQEEERGATQQTCTSTQGLESPPTQIVRGCETVAKKTKFFVTESPGKTHLMLLE
jgi:hypothetical protein